MTRRFCTTSSLQNKITNNLQNKITHDTTSTTTNALTDTTTNNLQNEITHNKIECADLNKLEHPKRLYTDFIKGGFNEMNDLLFSVFPNEKQINRRPD